MDFRKHTIASVHAGLAKKEFSAREIVSEALQSITAKNSSLNAFLAVREKAVSEAEEVDRRLAAGEAVRPLDGIPIALKDNLVMLGERTTAASKILEPYHGTYTGTAVTRLQAAGAVIVGKTNLDEFAMGSSTENSAFGPSRNPWNPELVPGGSSGGSAVAVAGGMAMAALGSDTGGSIRQPASFTNLVGFKPTYGRVSRYGLIALASSLDQIGPFTRTVEDAARVYAVMAGHDDNDATSSPKHLDDLQAVMGLPLTGLRVGLPKEFFVEGVDPAVAAIVMTAAKELEQQGATIVDVSVPHAPQALATYYIILPAEASSNLARFDGIRYGLSDRSGNSLGDVYRRTRDAGFGAEVKRRIILGTFALSSGYSDAYYHQANRVRAVLREEFHQVFDSVDVLLTPTSPILPFPFGDKTKDPLQMYLADLLTIPANLANIPAMSLPAGFVNGLPVGMQLMAREWDEATIFRTAAAYQRATDWHARTPAA